jgi:cysteinyl-tRNA synthetase
LTWSEELLAQARSSLDSLYQALRDATSQGLTSENFDQLPAADYPDNVVSALCDDLNTPKALAALHDLSSRLRKAKDDNAKSEYRQALLAGGWLLGLLVRDPEAYFTGTDLKNAAPGITVDAIEGLIEERKSARKDGNFQRADEIRDELLKKGIELEDSREGTRWRKI